MSNLKKQPIKFTNPANLVATIFGIGRIPYMPGTFGALFAAIEFAIYLKIFNFKDISIYLIHIFSFTIIGIIAAHFYCKYTQQQDPGEVVIDEYIGQYLAQIICFIYCNYFIPNLASSLWIITISFLFFRLFDISKVGIVGYCDKNIKGAVGIILDDVVAAIIAAICSIFTLQIIAILFYA